MNVESLKQFIELRDIFESRMSVIIHIGWGCKISDFDSIRPDNEVIKCIWDYEPTTATVFDEDIIPVSLLWATNEEVANYFIDIATKHRDNVIDKINNRIKYCDESIKNCDIILERFKRYPTNDEDAQRIYELQHCLKTSNVFKKNEQLREIEKTNTEYEHKVNEIKERLKSL